MDFKNMSISELSKIQSALKNELDKKVLEEYKKEIENNSKYLNKCYYDKKEKLYLKVLSAKGSNGNRVECLCFKLPVRFTEFHNAHYPHSIFSEIEFEGFYIDDYPMFCNGQENGKKIIDELQEISEEEFFEKFDEYIRELKEKIKNGYFDTSQKL